MREQSKMEEARNSAVAKSRALPGITLPTENYYLEAPRF